MKKNKSLWLIILAALAGLFLLHVFQIGRFNRQSSNFSDESVIGQGKPVLLQISSADCPPCRRMMPVLADLNARYADHFTIALISLDNQPQAQSRYNVQAVPTQIFFDEQGNALHRHTGGLTADQVLSLWSQLGVKIQ